MKTRQFIGMTLLAITMMLMVATNSMAQSKPWAKLDNGVLTFTYGPKPSASASVKCTNCGKMLSNADKFCSKCGTKKQDVQVFAVPLNSQVGDDIPWSDSKDVIYKVVISPSFKQVRNILSTCGWFKWLKISNIEGLENLRTDNVKNMSFMFFDSKITSLDLRSFNTRNVTIMKAMFGTCENLTSLNLSSFNTTNVSDMSDMFWYCSKLTSLNLSSFNTSKVTKMDGMFGYCSNLTTLNLSNFITSNVSVMNAMFSHCSNLTTLNLCNFDTRNVTDMYVMFLNCKKLTSLDLSSFNTNKVTQMGGMFKGCTQLKTITVSATGWQTSQAGKDDMFSRCPAQIIKK